MKEVKRVFNLITSIINVSKPHSQRENQEWLVQLLENRLTDKDYVDSNAKLLSKKEDYKRKYFLRYFNILSKKRDNIQ